MLTRCVHNMMRYAVTLCAIMSMNVNVILRDVVMNTSRTCSSTPSPYKCTIISYRATSIDTPGWLHSAYVGLPSQMCGDDDAAAR
jgi:hypothetical protein